MVAKWLNYEKSVFSWLSIQLFGKIRIYKSRRLINHGN